ncbi:increased DNA methylation 1-like [Magnolia sinica]|uniref:increased DNA methylation 1-like n=1 Tax=Magnolia sinica TaxID=86752 RepID=UPI002658F578|nr:increased DNA methylation 1-like [Magnolia sinica]
MCAAHVKDFEQRARLMGGLYLIFFHLQKFLGKSNPTDIGDLSWTILRSNEKDGHDLHTSSYIEAMTNRKLENARAVLRDCYGRIVQPVTKTNLIKDIVFSKESKLPYQNYRGFYTMILDRGKRPISVATFRVHGDKVAEVPLLGTRVTSRQRGMARLLMNNLQKRIQYPSWFLQMPAHVGNV